MFILSNNKSINEDAIIEAMLDPIDSHIYWLDCMDGQSCLETILIKKMGDNPPL